jgi:hypothetical protein
MPIIKIIFDRLFGNDDPQMAAAARIIDELANDAVTDWQDVDDFLHCGFRNKMVCHIGEVCGAIARVLPGNISGLFSLDAVPYLLRIKGVMMKTPSEINAEMRRIMNELQIDWLKIK